MSSNRGGPKRKTVKTGFEPHVFQEHAFRKARRFSVLVAHRRWGKTVFAVNKLIDAALKCDKKNPQFGYVAPFRNQAKKVAWKYIKAFTEHIPGVQYNESELVVTFKHNGAQIGLYGADNADALRGMYWDGIVLDEVADMKPAVWGEIIRPACADRKGWVLFIGTPKGINLFHELFQYASSGKDDEWFAGFFPISRCLDDLDWLDEKEIAMARATMSESQYRQEFECDFNASCENALITIDMVAAARGKHLRSDQYNRQPKIVGVDVARFGDDNSAIVKRQGLALLEIREFLDVDNMTLADHVAMEIHRFQPDAVFIDAGRGEGVIDRLRQIGHRVIEVNFGARALDKQRYSNRRAEMWDNCAKWLSAGGALPDHDKLCGDLVVPTYSFDAAGRMVLEKKEDMKERVGFSPDRGDALALTFAQPVGPSRMRHPPLAEHGTQRANRPPAYTNSGQDDLFG